MRYPLYQFTSSYADEPEQNQELTLNWHDLNEIFPFVQSIFQFRRLILEFELVRYEIKKLE